MSTAEEARTARLFVILNPKAGTCTAEDVRAALGQHFSCEDGSCNIHETTGHENLAELARKAVAEGRDLVVAAGGDGTVSGVADGLIGAGVPLGIVPLGTANVLARELGIPVALEEAVALLSGKHAVRAIDAMEVGGKHYFTQVGVGLDAMMIRDTRTEAKRRFGRVAYLWTAATSLVGLDPRKFTLTVDGEPVRGRATQVVLANVGTLGQQPFRWGPGIKLDDGRINVCVVRAKAMTDYLKLAWHVVRGTHKDAPNVRYLEATRSVAIQARPPLPVQGDGEHIGETPVVVKVVPGALKVAVPEGAADAAAG